MNKMKKQFLKRAIAVFLSAMIAFSMIPLNLFVSVATNDVQDEKKTVGNSFTVVITDGKNYIADAEVNLKNKTAQYSETVKTNSQGEAKFTALSALESTYLEDTSDFICNYTVNANGYNLVTGEFSVKDAGGWFGTKEVVLTKTVSEITSSDYEITSYNDYYDGKIHDAVSVIAENCTVEYKIAGGNYTSVVPTVRDAGELEVEVKISKDGCADKIVNVKATVLKSNRNFYFEEISPSDRVYNPSGVKYVNVAKSEQEANEIVYTVDNENIAEIDAKSGELTLKKVGTVEVTAKMLESKNYNESIAKYNITLVAAERNFQFKTTAPSNITYDPKNVLFTNEAVNSENVGKITYSIEKQERDGKTVEDVATINKDTGEIKINASGKILVKAVVEEAGNYKKATATYSLTVNRADQNLIFENKNKNGLVYNEKFKNPLSGGLSEGKVKYEITQEISSTDNNKVVTVDEDGNVTAVGIGSATIKATKEADKRYNKASATFNITTVKAKQDEFGLGEDKTVYYGTKEKTFKAQGNKTDSDVEYSLVFPTGVVPFAVVDAVSGKITFEDRKTGSFTLKAQNSGNDFYEKAETSCVVTVEEKDFSVNRTVLGEKGNNGWYKSDYIITPSEGFKIGYNNSFGDDVEWLDKIEFTKEGTVSSFAYYLKEIKTGYISSVIINPQLNIDKNAPTLEITYSKAVTSLVKKLFYKDKVTVTLSSKDDISGIEKFAYSLDNSNVVCIGAEDISFNEENQTYFYNFDIDAQYNGKVMANVIDYAGHKASKNNLIDDGNETEIVVDNIAPNVTITMEDTVKGINGYFSAARSAIIRVEEKNFFAEDVKIIVSKRYNNELKYSTQTVKSDFVAVEGKKDTYETVIEFNENADYILNVKYTDKSGNSYECDEDIKFTVDTVAPVISISYMDGNTGYYCKSNKKAKVTVNEHNFDPTGISLSISGNETLSDGTINQVELADYQKQLRETKWEKDGDIYVGYIEIADEACYNLELSYNDLAGNVSNIVEDEFVIDKQAPTNLKIEYSEPVNKIQEWFYGDEIAVTISAFDSVSGIESFTYSYSVSDNVSSVNSGKKNVVVTEDMINKNGSYTFKIPAQFRGCVSFNAKDKSGNISNNKNDELVVIADNIAPGVSVKYDNNDCENKKYFKASRKATIEIEEANFWASDVKICVNGKEEKLSFGRKMDDNNLYVEDVYVAERIFDKDGTYVLSVEYEDRSNNSASYISDEFVIDKTQPMISISYDNNTVVNGKYFDANRTATILVNERNFSPDGLNFELKAVITNEDGTEKEVVSPSVYNSYIKNAANWESDGDIHKISLPEFNIDARYDVKVSYVDLAGNMLSENLHEEFVIDKNKATDLKIEYNEPENIFEKLLFFKDEVEVTVSAFDAVSGVRSFNYYYSAAEGASSINVSGKGNENFEEGTYKATKTFKIPSQYRGNLKLDVSDYACNESSLNDENILVVDNIAPGVSAVIDNNNVRNDKYYNAQRQATVTVTEANFWAEDVELIVYRRLDNETEYKKLNETYQFNEVEGKEDTYYTVIPFSENADYKFDIKYTDRSNNVYDNYDEVEFVVDKIAPVIELSYKNDSVPSNENNYNTNRIPVITVKEHNFDPKDFEFEIKGVVTGDNGQDVTVFTEDNGYLTYIKNIDNWHKNGDIYTIEMPELNVDARYTISKIVYTDLAGNESNVITDEFVIDKKAPSNLEIVYEETKWYENLFEVFTLGFYNSKTTVTLKAADNVSGLDCFTYSYTVGQGATAVNDGKENIKATPNNDGTYSFDIPAQFRGKVRFFAIDKANNISDTKLDYKVVIVDDKAPQVNVEFDNNSAYNGNYYNADRTATITVSEDNFWAEDVVITIGKRLDNETDFILTKDVRSFTPVENNPGVYTTQIKFEENADYTLDINYKDKSGNKAVYISNVGKDKETFEKLLFTVDKTSPVMSVDYDNCNANNANQYNQNRSAVITVVEHNFDPKDFSCAILGETISKNGVDLTSKMYTQYVRNKDNWISDGDTHTATIDFDIDAQYSVKLSYVDLAGNKILKDFNDSFGIDKVAPTKLEIEYAQKSVIDIILEGISFGFYQAPVKVILTGIDEISGVDYLTYSYTVSEDAGKVNSGKTNIVIPSDKLDRSIVVDNAVQYEKVTATFEMPAQFRGNVSFFATDKAGNVSEIKKDEKIIVVDDIAPVISVKYDNYTENQHYKTREATITVTEANFIANDVSVTINRRLDTESEFVKIDYVPQFSAVEGKEDTYEAIIKFNEISSNADYIFDIDYTDKSGNSSIYVVEDKKTVKDYTPDKFTIDTTLPEIYVDYDNNDVCNSDRFNADRTATITVVEHNFRSEDVDTFITAKNASEIDVEVENYKAYLKEASSWKNDGDIHTAVIKYTEEANYTFSISYTDPAGNKNSDVNYGESVATEKFTVDKTKPTANITVGEWSTSKNDTKWNKFLSNVTFSLWSNKPVDVKISSMDELSGLDTVEYFRSSEVLTLAQVKASEDWIQADTNKSKITYTVQPDERFVVYTHIVDKAGNEIYISSDGIILDKTLPNVETISPEVTVKPHEQPINGIYSEDVKVDLTVTDPINETVYSGLKSISYEIYNNSVSVNEPTQKGTLFTYNITAKRQSDLVQKYEEEACIIVDCKKNNSNDVTIKITAVDNSDNITVSTCDVKIDTTAPIIDISYDNNNADSKSFFNENRTATIVVTERNFNFENVVVEITNTDGETPKISSWKKIKGTGNLDDTKWIATVKYDKDGDYTFDIDYTDEAGLKCKKVNFAKDTVAAKLFTIDKTNPVVNVTYSNNNSVNSVYYVSDRIATVVIDEHNFNADRVKFDIKATNDGVAISSPKITSWVSNGDVHTCNIYYSSDAKYEFDIDVLDKAGNKSKDYNSDSFFIDKTDPEIEITNIENNSANSGKVAPIIRFSDTNFDRNNVKVVLSGVNRGTVSAVGSYSEIHNGVVFSFNNFDEEKSVDDIYTINVSITDKAGRSTSKSVTFSVNRFGSVYTLGDILSKLIDNYVAKTDDIVITETNPNKLNNIKLTLFKNGKTITLKENIDFRIDVFGGSGSWYRYVYTIFKDNFVDDGVYSLNFHSEDSAGNIAENTLDTKDTEISFGIDKTKPTINIKNIESNETYALDMLTVKMSIQDNLSLRSVTVELDGNKYCEWTGEDLKLLIDSGTDMTFDISGDSTNAHTVKVVAVDEAGNQEIEEIKNLYITTNLWVRYYTNKPLFIGSISVVIGIAAVIVFIITKKKRQKDN